MFQIYFSIIILHGDIFFFLFIIIADYFQVPHDFAPKNLRICSNDSQKVKDHGAIRNQQGRKPL